MIRLIYFIPIWILFLIFRTAMILLGWILVPIAAVCKAYEAVDDTDGAGNPRVEYHFTWKFMFPWDNYEDGIANDTYVKYESMFMKIIYWSCLRNPANNLRIIRYISCKIIQEKVKFIGSETDINLYDTPREQWFIAWQGLYSCFYWQFYKGSDLWRLWLGWKIYPTDINGVTEYRKFGAGFATQFKKQIEGIK